MQAFMHLALAVDLDKPAVIAGRPDGLAIGTCLHGEHTALMTGEVLLAQLQSAIAKAKSEAIANPSGTNSGGRIGQRPLVAL
jgi:hypothetical protein